MIRPGDHPSAAWASLAPGTVLNAVLETFDPPALPRRDLPRVAAAYQRQGAHLDAMQARIIAELAARVDPPGVRPPPSPSPRRCTSTSRPPPSSSPSRSTW